MYDHRRDRVMAGAANQTYSCWLQIHLVVLLPALLENRAIAGVQTRLMMIWTLIGPRHVGEQVCRDTSSSVAAAREERMSDYKYAA